MLLKSELVYAAIVAALIKTAVELCMGIYIK